MPDVKNLLMAVCTVLAATLAATLKCAPSRPSGDASNSGADAARTRLLAQGRSCRRTARRCGRYPNKLCLSCHDHTTINAANEDFGGIEDSILQAHLEAGDCTSCHSVDGTSTSPATSATTRRCPRAGRAPSAAPARSTA
ncbi:MAG: cytochrome C [Eggerthella lenta]